MRVLFLTLYPDDAASPRYRVTQYVPYLEAQGVQCTVASAVSPAVWRRYNAPGLRPRAARYHAHETPRRIAQLLGARGYDLVFVQKALCSAYVRGLPALLRACAPRFVYDLDDAVYLAPPHALRAPWSLLEDRAQTGALFRGARITLAGNAWLAAEAAAAGARAELVPTVADTDRFAPGAQADDTYRLGWIGSPSTAPALDAVLPALASVRDAEIVLIGAGAKRVDWPAVRTIVWSRDDEAAQVQQFSVGIAPLPRDAWSRGKCALKVILAMACGKPCIVTPYGAAREIVEDGVTGLYADTPVQWREAAERLRDPALRATMGAAARETIERRYSLRQWAPRLHALLREAAS